MSLSLLGRWVLVLTTLGLLANALPLYVMLSSCGPELILKLGTPS